MGLLDKIKSDIKKSGQNKGKIIYFREGEKKRIRFLNDMDDGMEIVFHDNFEKGINIPCQEIFGRNCPYCEEDAEVRTRNLYAWSVWDYEAKEVKLFMFAVNNCTPIPALMAMYENYGTITDKDYVISVSGKQQNKTYSVVPMDKIKFRNDKAKAFSEKAILKILDKAYPFDGADDEDEDEDEYYEKHKNKKASKSESKKTKRKEDDDDDWDEEENSIAYEEMSTKELYKLCKERGIDVEPRKLAKYYINELEEYDEAQDDWADEDEDDDDWEDE